MRVAVVGAGIAGLGAARRLAGQAEVEVFETEPRAGGHALTVEVDGTSVDVGFLVFEPRRYPRFTALLAELGVATRPTDMSFSSACAACGLEYGTTSLDALFAQRRRLLSPRHWRLATGILAFQRVARQALSGPIPGTLGALLARARVPGDVARHFVLPLAASLWSASPAEAGEFAAEPVLRFFAEHGMLTATGAPTWRTIVGGSRRYVDALLGRLPAALHLGSPVSAVRRLAGAGVLVDGRRFDAVVLAVHADRALRLLADPTEDERRALSAFRFGENEAVLHEDPAFLPQARRARASWNHRLLDCARPRASVEVTYDVSRLMRLPGPRRFLVTLNPASAPARSLARFRFQHPRLDLAALEARAALEALQGARSTWYCGAWLGAGFHEDGLASGEGVAHAILSSERRAA